ncbi:hypothetical protein [Microbacterium sp. No. 7]|uniref:hypothetical protein n=1 Tax=Microbacterium sp. No. 7 TaxID=1714373 RepID=UPI0006CFFBC4|nr:hypothetical protein [Microbacterium sp. No. 7]ALJ18982.1 hypothetical protein AOA12_03290 [Microbacterium sp. No. 7]
MARVGGRNLVAAWFVGLLCLGVVVTLVVLAAPMVPHLLGWTGPDAAETADETDDAPEAGPVGATDDCRALYEDALWTTLRAAPGSDLAVSTDAPVLSASAFVDGVQPGVTVTCAWTSERGSIVTTLATAPTDAGAIAKTALGPAGFACADVEDRVRCTREDGGTVETVEIGGGVWASTVQADWHPAGYADRIAGRVW